MDGSITAVGYPLRLYSSQLKALNQNNLYTFIIPTPRDSQNAFINQKSIDIWFPS
jgi:hypothetical protein